MFHSIIFSNAMWGYLQACYNMQPDKAATEPSYRVRESVWGDEFISVGYEATYGFTEPFKEHSGDDEEDLVNQQWHDDYYVALSEGTRNGRPLLNTSIKAGAFYPERLFMWGEDEEGNDLPRHMLLHHFKQLGMWKSTPAYWDPVRIWRGYNKGWPTFYKALRGSTDMGPRWHDIIGKLSGNLPDGYQWDLMPGCSYGTLYYETTDQQ
jgi:hypothetical protein